MRNADATCTECRRNVLAVVTYTRNGLRLSQHIGAVKSLLELAPFDICKNGLIDRFQFCTRQSSENITIMEIKEAG